MLEDTLGKTNSIKSLVNMVLEKTDYLLDKLQICIVISDSMTYEEQEKLQLNRYRDQFEQILTNIEFKRQIQKILIINQNVELALAYYGENYGKDANVEYDLKLQETINKIEKLIREFIGIIMNHVLKTEELEL